MSSESDQAQRDQLQRARELIMNKQFDQARLILLDLPTHPVAQQWLAKLEEVAPTGTGPVAAPPAQPPRDTSASPIQPLAESEASALPPAGAPAPGASYVPPVRHDGRAGSVNITLDVNQMRYVVAGLAGVMAIMMIISFFLAPWLDLTQVSFFGMDFGAMAGEFDVDEGPLKITAIELWMGRNNGENFTLDVENPKGGFAQVRLLDRLLILIPVGAIVLAWFAWIYASADTNGAMTVGIMTVLALVLLLAPFAWESLSNQQIEDAIMGEMDTGGEDFGFDLGLFGGIFNPYKDTYNTTEQKVTGGLALLFCLAGFGLEVLNEASASQRRR